MLIPLTGLQPKTRRFNFIGLLLLVTIEWIAVAPGEEGNFSRLGGESPGLEYFNQVKQLVRAGKLQEARDTYNQALDLFHKEGQLFLEAETLSELGVIYRRLGQIQTSLEFQFKALELYNRLGKTREKAIALRRIGVVYRNLGELKKSLEAQHQALALMEELGDPEGIADSRMNLSAIYVNLGRLRDALKVQQEALEIYKTLQRTDKMAFALGNLGLTQLFLGNLTESIKNQRRSLEIKQQQGDVYGEGNARVNLGLAYAGLGDYSRALEQYWEALHLYQKIGNKQGEAVTLSNMGDLFNELGDLNRAETYYRSSLTLRREIQDKIGLVITLKNLALLYRKEKDWVKAKNFLQEGLELVRELKHLGTDLPFTLPLLEGDLQQGMGLISQDQGEGAAALENFEKALTLYEGTDYSQGVMETWGYMGDGYGLIGDWEKSLSAYKKGLELARRENRLHIEAHLLHRLGLVYGRMGQEEMALQNFLDAINQVESLRANLEEADIRRLYTQQKSNLYRDTIRLLLRRGKVEEALFYLERFRARTFLETLLSGPSLKIKEGSPLLVEEQELFAEIRFLHRQINLLSQSSLLESGSTGLDTPLNEVSSKSDPAYRFNPPGSKDSSETRNLKSESYLNRQLLELKEELESAKNRYEELWIRIQLTQPDYAHLKSVKAEELREMMTKARALLDPEVAIIEYFLDEEKIYIWVVTKERLVYREVPISREIMTREVLAFRSSVKARISPPAGRAEGGPSRDFVDPAKKLHEALIAPVEEVLAGKKVLGIVPHEILNFIPFAALKNQRYLIQDYAVFYLPSLSLLPLLREKNLENKRYPVPGELLAMGNPYGNLPGAEAELKSLSRVFSQVTLYQGSEASKERFMKLSPSYQILHLATHSVYDKEKPLLSYLELASEDPGDGRFYVSQVLGLSLKANLVTLSGCETSLPQDSTSQEMETLVSGDEIIAFNRAFMYAGVPTVLSSLWRVSDFATPILMYQFYQNLKTKTRAEALRQASLMVMGQHITHGRRTVKDLSLSHPFFWAPFVLVGDWK
ncbi:MAG TPA: CHAT domain-containing protein [Candidatus Limnocylindrales bacterium]|nr:CHAT domain-containing protein [Candidatus Limnocylindrales bacterium]